MFTYELGAYFSELILVNLMNLKLIQLNISEIACQ
jgi:hypothetical protein